MDDHDQTTREWFFHHYLRYWYWVGIIFVFIVAAGTAKSSMDDMTFGSFLFALLLFLLLFGYYVYQRIWPGSMRGPRDKIRALFESRKERDKERYRERSGKKAEDDEETEDEKREPIIVSGRLGGRRPRR